MPPLFLIVGSPASGKSTASRALAARFPRSISICVDDLRSMVVSGLVHPSPEWSGELAAQLRLARRSAATMAQLYHTAGYAVMIDDFWDPYTQLSEYGDLLNHPAMQRVLLYPDQQKAHERNHQRFEPGPLREYLDEGIGIVYADLRQVVDQLAQQGWSVLDTTNDTVEASASRLQALAHYSDEQKA
jgi:hypothetical protein